MIRDAKHADINRLLVLAEEFLTESPYEQEFNEDKVTCLLAMMLQSPVHILRVCEKDGEIIGALGVAISDFMFSKQKLGQEMFWFVGKEHRNGRAGLSLLKDMETVLKEKGIDMFIMTSLAQTNNLDAFFSKVGYEDYEHSYMKRL